MLIKVAWLWVRHQPDPALTAWFKERDTTACAARSLPLWPLPAQELPIAIWKYVNAGVVIEGAAFKLLVH